MYNQKKIKSIQIEKFHWIHTDGHDLESSSPDSDASPISTEPNEKEPSILIRQSDGGIKSNNSSGQNQREKGKSRRILDQSETNQIKSDVP